MTGPQIKSVVLTGGPCAGKTSMVPIVEEWCKLNGIRLFKIPEIASMYISSGIDPRGLEINVMSTINRAFMRTQMDIENVAAQTAKETSKTDSLILCDRAVLDSAAYVPPHAWHFMIHTSGQSTARLLDRYDMVLHLQSVAVDKPELYQGNSIRTEDVAASAIMDGLTLRAWEAHPEHKLIDNRGDFKTKARSVLGYLEHLFERPGKNFIAVPSVYT